MRTVENVLASKGHAIYTVRADETVLDAAKRMNQERIGALVVCDPAGKVAGIFTERDILRRVVAEGKSPEATRLQDVMTAPVTCCHPDSTVNECQTVMTSKRLRHLPVVMDGQLLGMISIGDIMAQEVEAQQHTIEYLHEYMHGRV